MLIELTLFECEMMAALGVKRRLVSIRDKRVDKIAPQFDADIVGAIGEYAVARALGKPFQPLLNTFKLPDVGELQVRATRWPRGHLIVREDDPEGVYVLVTVNEPRAEVHGWLTAKEARQDKYWGNPDETRAACWSVPQYDLHPLNTLRERT